MRWSISALAAVAALALYGCGGEAGSTRTLASRQALTSAPEMVEFQAPNARQKLFQEMALVSQFEAGRPSTSEAFFPIVRDADVVSAPGLDPRADLLQLPDSGLPVVLTFDGSGDKWPTDSRESLQGLSEREAAELVAQSLLKAWGIHPQGTIQVDRAAAAPYAAAYVNGILRINPALLYLAAAASAASTAAPNQ